MIVKKSKAEAKEQKKAHAEKAQLKKQRREEQERNVALKKQKIWRRMVRRVKTMTRKRG